MDFIGELSVELARLVVLAFIIERGLSVVFDWRWYTKYLNEAGLKVPIAVGLSWLVTYNLQFDLLPLVFPKNADGTDASASNLGIFLTALVVAGGSAAAIRLFQDVLGFSKTARDATKKVRLATAEAAVEEAEAKKRNAGAVNRWGYRLNAEMQAAGKEAVDLEKLTNADSATVSDWIAEVKPVPQDKQILIAAWLGKPVRDIFSDLGP